MSDHDEIALAVVLAVVLLATLYHLPQPSRLGVWIMARVTKADEIRSYGSGAKQAQRLGEPFRFQLTGLRWDDEETHDFTAVRKADALLAARFMGFTDDQAGELLRLCGLLVGKTLDNSDGVPVQWTPEPLPKPRNAGVRYEPKFRGPDGELYPMSHAEKFTEFSAGSSRRRWQALLADNEFTCDMEVFVEIVKDLIEAGAGSPTSG